MKCYTVIAGIIGLQLHDRLIILPYLLIHIRSCFSNSLGQNNLNYRMSQDTLERYAELFQQIRENSKTSFHGFQLECISRLVFFGGVQRQLIPKFQIRDVFDGNGKPLNKITKLKSDKITKFKKPIILNDEMKRALEDYFKDLKFRCSSYTNRTSRLFRDYRYDLKLRRHWKKFGTSYTQIKRDREVYKGEQERQRREEQNRIIREFIANYKGDIIYDDYDD